ncbi:MAG: ABC transporter permease, partial [Acidimicrobiaceae bacterium]|nr:ABC transporter permease [Acidimicrobiaceae bacterium]
MPPRITATRRPSTPLVWLGALLVVYLAAPLVAFLVRSAGSNDRGFGTPGLWGALRTSVAASSVATLLVCVVGIPLAYRLARHPGRLASIVGIAVQLPLALPPLMAGVVLIYVVGPYTTIGRWFGGHLTDTFVGLVIAQSFVSSPFLVISARSAFAASDPALEDAATTLGLRPTARLFRVAIPAAAPGIRAGILLTWLRAFGEYGANVLLAYHPYSLPVFTYVQFSGSGIPTTQAPTLLAIGVAAVVIALGYLHLPLRRKARLA